MDINTATDKIKQAQDLLYQVYTYYGNMNSALGRSLSLADTCCEDALVDLLMMKGGE